MVPLLLPLRLLLSSPQAVRNFNVFCVCFAVCTPDWYDPKKQIETGIAQIYNWNLLLDVESLNAYSPKSFLILLGKECMVTSFLIPAAVWHSQQRTVGNINAAGQSVPQKAFISMSADMHLKLLSLLYVMCEKVNYIITV